jgi:polyhydroxyalkanoate synthesis regulator phasin
MKTTKIELKLELDTSDFKKKIKECTKSIDKLNKALRKLENKKKWWQFWK